MSRRRPRVPGTTKNTLFVIPEIPDDAPSDVKNALAIRNTASVEGKCPSCGATPELRADPEHQLVIHATFRHEPWCGAMTDGKAA